MTIEQAKEAVKNRVIVMYKGSAYRANGIITWYKFSGYDSGWRNSLDLIPTDGTRSVTQALVRDCTLIANGTQA